MMHPAEGDPLVGFPAVPLTSPHSADVQGMHTHQQQQHQQHHHARQASDPQQFSQPMQMRQRQVHKPEVTEEPESVEGTPRDTYTAPSIAMAGWTVSDVSRSLLLSPLLSNVRRLVRRLKTLDVYPKTEEDISIKTGSGGLISIVSLTVIALLMLSQVWSFISPPTTHTISVDTRPSSQLQINVDIVFHALRCSETTIDVMDVSGESQVAIDANVHRTRLTSEGRPIGGEYEDHAHDRDVRQPIPQGLPPQLAQLMQQGLGGPGGLHIGPDQHADKKGEGCHIAGVLRVNKVAGNVHVALGGMHSHGKSDSQEHGSEGHGSGDHDHGHAHGQPQQQHVHQFMIHEMANYNCSHTIRHLSFGERYPGVVNPLDSTSQIIPASGGSAHMQYFLKVVPTVYEGSFGGPMDTNQFSVTQQTHPISMQDVFNGGGGQRVPGVFFVYEISPFMVRVSSARMPFSTFITSLFAILGGVLTVAGIIDSVLYHSSKLVKVTSPKK